MWLHRQEDNNNVTVGSVEEITSKARVWFNFGEFLDLLSL